MFVYLSHAEPGDFIELGISESHLRLIQLYPELLDFLEVISFGSKKHGNSWLESDGATMSLNDNCSSLFRHLAKKQAGQTLDADSGMDHDLHIACRAMMSYYRKQHNIKHSKDK